MDKGNHFLCMNVVLFFCFCFESRFNARGVFWSIDCFLQMICLSLQLASFLIKWLIPLGMQIVTHKLIKMRASSACSWVTNGDQKWFTSRCRHKLITQGKTRACQDGRWIAVEEVRKNVINMTCC